MSFYLPHAAETLRGVWLPRTPPRKEPACTKRVYGRRSARLVCFAYPFPPFWSRPRAMRLLGGHMYRFVRAQSERSMEGGAATEGQAGAGTEGEGGAATKG